MSRTKQYLSLKSCVLFLSFSFFLSACVDKAYDVDDVDKSAVFSPDGINIPLGDIQKINLFDEIKKKYDKIYADEEGTLYTSFDGKFDISLPQLGEIPYSETEVTPVVTTYPALVPNIELPPITTIANEKQEKFIINLPQITDNEWNINVQNIHFKKCQVWFEVTLKGIDFATPPERQPATLDLLIEMPEGFGIKDNPTRIIKKSIEITAFNYAKTNRFSIDVENYSYRKNPIFIYSAMLNNSNEGTSISHLSGFEFNMSLKSGIMEPEIVYAETNATQNIDCSITETKAFYNAFPGNRFCFYNPTLALNNTSNIGIDYQIKVDKLSGEKENHPISISIPTSLAFQRPEAEGKLTSKTYNLSPIEDKGINWIEADLNKVFNTQPDKIECNLVLSSQEQNTYFIYDNIIMDFNYSLKMPFSFSDLDISFSSTIKHLFSQHTYEDLFQDATGDISILSNHVDIAIGNQPEATIVTVSARITDETSTDINVKIKDIILSNKKDQTMAITIEKDELSKMEKARNLILTFHIATASGLTQPLKLTKDDYISIKSLKLNFQGGMHFDL